MHVGDEHIEELFEALDADQSGTIEYGAHAHMRACTHARPPAHAYARMRAAARAQKATHARTERVQSASEARDPQELDRPCPCADIGSSTGC